MSNGAADRIPPSQEISLMAMPDIGENESAHCAEVKLGRGTCARGRQARSVGYCKHKVPRNLFLILLVSKSRIEGFHWLQTGTSAVME